MHPSLVERPFVVKELKWETADTFTLVLAPEDGLPNYDYKPGQWLYLHLLNDDGTMWARAAYSVASAPSQSKQTLELSIKLAGDFTKRASKLMPDDKVRMQGPFGVFCPAIESDKPVVFFAGGIGVTPFRSYVEECVIQGSKHPIVLVYSNRTIEEAPFMAEIQKLADQDLLIPILILTRDAPDDWPEPVGRLNESHIEKLAPVLDTAMFYACGPDDFMKSVKELLAAKGVDVKTRYKQESFG
ncbi:MAG: FAD-dependent oxidoreductase [Candidatus Magasanikbacteria bacterium]|nr:FAD-dependent oxidoreductase [Candidatus Magasanikbacteria bacterium]MCA9391425.1 FAD-dependent oxidoreductase [Candidatus Magasanikbacteria bacterium]